MASHEVAQPTWKVDPLCVRVNSSLVWTSHDESGDARKQQTYSVLHILVMHSQPNDDDRKSHHRKCNELCLKRDRSPLLPTPDARTDLRMRHDPRMRTWRRLVEAPCCEQQERRRRQEWQENSDHSENDGENSDRKKQNAHSYNLIDLHKKRSVPSIDS